jgi:hypothetical protein
MTPEQWLLAVAFGYAAGWILRGQRERALRKQEWWRP